MTPDTKRGGNTARTWRGIAFAVCGGLALAACELPEWLGAPEEKPLPGERISVLRLDQVLEPDPGIADLQVRLPRPWRNLAWPQAAGFASHAMHHLEIADDLGVAWRADIGAGSDSEQRLLARPVTADGRIYVMDAEATVSALDAQTGRRLWRRDLTPEDEDSGSLGGGVAFAGGVVFAATPYGFVHAIDAETGRDLWQRRIGVPMRGAPTAAGGRVFAISYDNRLFALAAEDGRLLWEHAGIPEDAGLVGSPSAAVDGDIVVAPYTSGELFALRIENGRRVWSDQLVRAARLTPLASLSEIRGSPVIDRGTVVAVSHSGRIAAIDLRTGTRLWDRDIPGVETPWIAGDFIYMLTTQSEVVCLSRQDGRIRWIVQLAQYENEKDQEDPIQWSGPVLASDRLIVVSSHGTAAAISPYTGDVLGQLELPAGSYIAPVVADGVLYILTDNAQLIALK